MHCATCGQPLELPAVEGGGAATIVLTVGSRPLPLRCRGCARVVCHVCQTTASEDADGVSAARVDTRCSSCGDALELMRGAAPAPEPEPASPPRELTREERKALKREYKERQAVVDEAENARRRAQLERLLEPAPVRRRGVAPGGCLGTVALAVTFGVYHQFGTVPAAVAFFVGLFLTVVLAEEDAPPGP